MFNRQHDRLDVKAEWRNMELRNVAAEARNFLSFIDDVIVDLEEELEFGRDDNVGSITIDRMIEELTDLVRFRSNIQCEIDIHKIRNPEMGRRSRVRR